MKKLGIIFVLMFLMFGVSPVFAQTHSNNEEVAISIDGDSGSQITTIATSYVSNQQMYVVNSELMRELNRLLIAFEEAEAGNDEQLVNELREKIHTLKAEIRKATDEGEETQKLELAISTEATGISTASGVAATNIRSSYLDKYTELEDWKSKKTYYESLYSLTDEELKNKGYSKGREEVKKILEELEVGITKIRGEYEATNSDDSGAYTSVSSEQATVVKLSNIAITKPVVVQSGGEINDYYKLKISKVMAKELEEDESIAELKELKEEIDELIAELIRSKDEINVEEISELVTEIRVKAKEIKVDGMVVMTTGKNLQIRVNNRDLMIAPADTEVVIMDQDLEIKARELIIKNEVLKVGDFEVKLTASDIAEKMGIEPKEIELKEEGARLVYKIKADEDRKLLGFIPVTVEKSLTVDASNTEVETIKEETPWWSFFTVK